MAFQTIKQRRTNNCREYIYICIYIYVYLYIGTGGGKRAGNGARPAAGARRRVTGGRPAAGARRAGGRAPARGLCRAGVC